MKADVHDAADGTSTATRSDVEETRESARLRGKAEEGARVDVGVLDDLPTEKRQPVYAMTEEQAKTGLLMAVNSADTNWSVGFHHS